jgi:[CysO sulfur-carrier protein]-S-L-cysteine hydrolase
MFKLILPRKIRTQLAGQLRAAGRREIGGCILAESLGNDSFRIDEITVQNSGGPNGSFVRDPEFHRPAIDAFFRRNNNDYERFNYLGEWHSHPSFSTRPSSLDIQEMGALLADKDAGATFAVLMIVRMRFWSGLDAAAYLFRLHALPVQVLIASDGKTRWL